MAMIYRHNSVDTGGLVYPYWKNLGL